MSLLFVYVKAIMFMKVKKLTICVLQGISDINI